MEAFVALFRALLSSARDLLPIVIVITFFQLVVLPVSYTHLTLPTSVTV